MLHFRYEKSFGRDIRTLFSLKRTSNNYGSSDNYCGVRYCFSDSYRVKRKENRRFSLGRMTPAARREGDGKRCKRLIQTVVARGCDE